MHFQLPKPLHGWRKFAGEVGIIVLGVLIALGLGQMLDAWHWQNQVDDAVVALGLELGETVGQGQERLNVATCVDRRLDELAAVVDSAASSGRLPALGRIGIPPIRTYSTGVWQSTLASQTAEHFTIDQRTIYSVMFGFSDQLAAINLNELAVWTRLATMSGPGRSLSPGDADALRLAVSQARTDNQVMLHDSVRIQHAIAGWRVPFDRAFAKSYDQPASAYSVCRPIGPPPPHYGTSPVRDAIGNAKHHPSTKGHVGTPIAGAAD